MQGIVSVLAAAALRQPYSFGRYRKSQTAAPARASSSLSCWPAAVLALYEASSAMLATDGYERLWLGQRIGGQARAWLALLNAALCAAAAVGAVAHARLARWLGMLYLGYLIGSFLIWGSADRAAKTSHRSCCGRCSFCPFSSRPDVSAARRE
jgi:hypothetical protein